MSTKCVFFFFLQNLKPGSGVGIRGFKSKQETVHVLKELEVQSRKQINKLLQ